MFQMKINLQKQASGQIWPAGRSLSVPIVEDGWHRTGIL